MDLLLVFLIYLASFMAARRILFIKKQPLEQAYKALLLLAIIPMILIEVFAAVHASLTHDGFCYGLTDGKWPCNLTEYIFYQMEVVLFFFSIPLNFGWIICLGIMMAIRFNGKS